MSGSNGGGRVFAWLAAAAALVTVLAYFNLKPSAGAKSTPTDQTTTQATERAGGNKTHSPAPRSAEPPDKILDITADIASGSKIGPNRARACPEIEAWCVGLIPVVTARAGSLGSDGCYLTWTLYRTGSKRVIDAGIGPGCDSFIYAGWGRALPAGQYRLHLKVETDSGQVATGDYVFTAVNARMG
jgi:hypothetical protein